MNRLDRDWVPAPSTVLLGAAVLPLLVVYVDLIALDLIDGSLPLDISTFADLAGVYGSVVLTAALVLLYREQTRIQGRQEQWMEAEHVPDVFVERWRLDTNRVTLWLSNLGTGVARNLHAEISIEETPDTDRLLAREQLAQRKPYNTVLQTRQEGPTKMDAVLRFDASRSPGPVDEETRTIPEVLRRIRSETADGVEVSVTLTLGYEYIRRTESRKSVFSWEAELADVESLEDLVQDRNGTTESELDVPPQNRREPAQ